MSLKINSGKLVHEIRLRNFLSFGNDSNPVQLKELNVLIGPNASGKSNLIDALSFLRSTPKTPPGDLESVIIAGGGVQEWIWKGETDKTALIEVLIDNPERNQNLKHFISFKTENQRFKLTEERIENEKPYPGAIDAYFYYRYKNGTPVANVRHKDENSSEQRRLEFMDSLPDRPILSELKDPISYPELSYLGDMYRKIRIYREWSFGRNTVFREPQKADKRNDILEEDFSNLGLFLNRICKFPAEKKMIIEKLHDLYEEFTDFNVIIEGGTVQVFFTENNYNVPATRLSDGTLRFLCLLAILCDPTPPPLVCIEEPEIGLHPDIIPKVADLLLQASKRTQLIVTTHSEILVDSLTEHPQTILVCEKHEGQTMTSRLEKDNLQKWLESYRLGQLWLKGELGGTRW